MKKLLVFLLVLGLAAPVMASDWHFYGSARTHLGYYSVDENYASGPDMDPSIRSNGLDDDSGTLLNIGGQSRFGAKAILSDNFSGNFELGLSETDGGSELDGSGGVYLRLLYGTWNFGAGSLSVGKRYTPATFLGYSNMIGDLGDNGDAVMLVAGLAYIGRQPQIRLTFGGFDVALIQPTWNATVGGAPGADNDFTIPKIEASYVFRTPVVSIRPILGFQTYEIEDQVTGDSEDITSYLAGLGASFKLGPAYIKLTGSYLQNPRNYGQNNFLVFAHYYGANGGSAQLVDGDIEDAKLMQGTFVVGADLNKMFSLEAGFGMAKIEVDAAATAGATAEQTGMVYYLQAQLRLAKGITVIPEVGFLDQGDLKVDGAPDTDCGDMTYFDVNFRVDF